MRVTFLTGLAAAVLATTAQADIPPPPVQSLEAVCSLVCGDWGPEVPSRESPQMKLRLAWDEASGEIRGEKISTGWEGGGADTAVAVSYRADAAGALWLIVDQPGLGRLESSVTIEPEGLRIIGLVPGKPDLVAVTIITFPAPDTMNEVQAESGQQYNNTVNDVTYKRVKP
ncbi:hypothetical protein sos41_29870 [Alphaproteobacteria bacterium SO-S41]|nr:hypothetical protein sos41_29870 [Alphaproteobacteria bacterium SO-S41]